MKRFLAVLLALAVSLPAAAVPTEYSSTTQAAASGTTPTLVTEGVSLAQAKSFRVQVSAVSGQTLSGSGSLLCYFWSVDLARWARCSTLLDVTVSDSAVRDSGPRSFTVDVPRGRVYYKPSSVTISGGTNVVVSIEVLRGE